MYIYILYTITNLIYNKYMLVMFPSYVMVGRKTLSAYCL